MPLLHLITAGTKMNTINEQCNEKWIPQVNKKFHSFTLHHSVQSLQETRTLKSYINTSTLNIYNVHCST